MPGPLSVSLFLWIEVQARESYSPGRSCPADILDRQDRRCCLITSLKAKMRPRALDADLFIVTFGIYRSVCFPDCCFVWRNLTRGMGASAVPIPKLFRFVFHSHFAPERDAKRPHNSLKTTLVQSVGIAVSLLMLTPVSPFAADAVVFGQSRSLVPL
jgi:hypothetical protein